jgi:hypothetical protein
MVAATFAFTYWIANFNNPAPTPIDGVWDVAQVRPQNLATQTPKTRFFEYNRAYMVVFKTDNGLYKTHPFEVDPKSRRIDLGEMAQQRKPDIWGTYTLADSEGTWQGVGAISLRLNHRPVR